MASFLTHRGRLPCVGALSCALLFTGCFGFPHHHFVYDQASVPEIRGGDLLVRAAPGAEPQAYPLAAVYVHRVRGTQGAVYLTEGTDQDLDDLLRGQLPPDVVAVELEVEGGRAVWGQYALPGLGIGLSMGILVAATFVDEAGENLALVILPASLSFGMLGTMIGLGSGTVSMIGTTDMRYP